MTNENINKISYIKPDNCEIDNIKINKYQTTIINDKITLDNNNLENFLKNFYNYNFSIKKYIICLKNNNTYYENIIKELIKD